MSDLIDVISQPNLTTLRFHFYSLKFTPYNDQELSSNLILSKAISYVTNQHLNNKGHLIDRNQNKPSEGHRELFITRAVFVHKEKRIRCSIALLRDGRVPMLKPADKFKLIPLDKNTQGSIAEETHFFIDFSKTTAVVCVEFNYYGPRASDIEFYLRNLARDTLHIAKFTELTMYIDTPIDKALADLKNVLNIDIKVQPKKLGNLDLELIGQYFTTLTSFGNSIKPKFIKLEAMFQTPGNTIRSSEINTAANKMVTNLLQKFKGRRHNIDAFDGFVVRYEDKAGQEEIFNLLKGKKEVVKEVDLKKITKLKEWYELIQLELDDFIENL